jgi:hypothetical protein
MHFRFLIAGRAGTILKRRDAGRICAFVYFRGMRAAAGDDTGENQ